MIFSLNNLKQIKFKKNQKYPLKFKNFVLVSMINFIIHVCNILINKIQSIYFTISANKVNANLLEKIQVSELISTILTPFNPDVKIFNTELAI